jgi:hypothetical protein
MRLRISAVPRARLRDSILRAKSFDNDHGLSDHPFHYISFDTRLCFPTKQDTKSLYNVPRPFSYRRYRITLKTRLEWRKQGKKVLRVGFGRADGRETASIIEVRKTRFLFVERGTKKVLGT